jgi:phage-related protein
VLIGEASIRLDAIADDLKRTIDRDINEALAGVKIDSDPLVKMTQDLNKAELELVKAEDQLQAAHRGTQESEAKLIDLRRSGTATTNEVSTAERALTRARTEEAVAVDRVTIANQRLAGAHGALTKAQRDNEVVHRSWARRLRDSATDANGLGGILSGVLGGALKSQTSQLSALGSVGEGVFSALTSKAVLMPAALAPLLGVIGGLIIAFPALAAAGGVALGAIALGMDGIKRAFKPLADDLDNLKAKVSSSFESALAPAVAKLPALFGAATTGLQAMATALGGLVTQLTDMLTTSENLAKIRDLFIQTAFFVKAMGPGIQQFTQGFLNLASAVAPQLEGLGQAIGGLLGSFGQAFDRLSQLGLVKPAIDGLIQVFGALGKLISPILEIFGRLAATLQGPLATVIIAIATGLQAAMPGIQAFADGIGKAFVALAPALQAILPLVGQVAGLIGGVLGTAISVLAPPLTKLIEGLSAGLAPVLPKISQAFSDLGTALAPVLDQLAGVLVQALDQLLPIIPQLVGALVQMAPAFLEIVRAVLPLIPPLVQLVASILPPLIRLWVAIEQPLYVFAGTVLNKVVPAIVTFISWVQTGVTKVIDFFNNFGENVSKIWANVIGFFTGIGDKIGDVFSGIESFFSSTGSSISTFFSDLGSKVASGFGAALDFIKGLPAKVGGFLATLPGIVGRAMLDAAQFMLNAAIQGVEWVIAELIALPIQIAFVLVQAGKALWDGLVSAFTTAKQAVVDGVTAIVDFFVALPGRVVDAVSSLATSLSTWATGVWNSAAAAVAAGIENVITFFRELPGRAIAAVGSLVTNISNWAHNVWSSAAVAVAAGISNVITFFQELPGRAISAVGSLIGSLRSFFTNTWNNAVSAVSSGISNVIGLVSGLPGRVLGALGDIGGFLYNAGRNIIQGFINGIKAAAGAIGNVVSGILGKVRNLLPSSPAKEGPFSGRGWTLYSGMSVMEAMAEGLRIAGDQVVKQAAAVVVKVQDALNITPTVGVGSLAGRTPSLPDLSGSGTQQAMAEAQLLALQALVDRLTAQGKTLPDDLAAAMEQLRVVVSANEVASGVKSVDQTNARRR